MDSGLPVAIVGGGLAGVLAALRLAERRPEVPLLLIEQGEALGGDHTWSFFDADIAPESVDLVTALEPVRWPRHRVRFPGRDRTFDMAYNAIGSAALDRLGQARLGARLRLGTAVASLAADHVLLASGERIAARAVIDARGPQGEVPGLQLGWQKFVGIEFESAAPTPDCATVMDACLPQIDGYRFVYVLPFGPQRVLVEDTYYSNGPELAVEEIAERVRGLAAERGIGGAELRLETGVLPIVLDGDPDVFWPAGDGIARLGLAGGFFHPTTGYSFGLALQMAEALARVPGPLDGAMLAAWSRARFLAHWDDGGFFRLLNRMLFRAGDPAERWRIFAHFYRISPERIARFYAGRLGLVDRARILTGKPPVAIGAALRAMRRR